MDSVVLVSFHVGFILSSTIGNGVLKSIVEICFCFPVYFFSLAVGSQLQNLSDLPHQDLVSCSDRNPAISPPGGRAACSHSPAQAPASRSFLCGLCRATAHTWGSSWSMGARGPGGCASCCSAGRSRREQRSTSRGTVLRIQTPNP